MTIRDTYFRDYGLTEESVRRIEMYCRNAKDYDQDLVLQAARSVYPEIAKYLFFSLTTGIGYDRMGKIPMQRKDFQGYRRKTIETFYRLMLEHGKDIAESGG